MLSLAVCWFVEQRTILSVWHVFVVVLILLCGALFHFIHMLIVFACLWSFSLDLSLVFTLFGLLCRCIVILQMFRVWLTYHCDCFSACFFVVDWYTRVLGFRSTFAMLFECLIHVFLAF